MRLMRSRHSRGSEPSLIKDGKKGRSDTNYFAGNWMSKFYRAVLTYSFDWSKLLLFLY